jgi:hypothetical protein
MKLLAAIFVIALAIMLGGALASPIQERWEDSNAYQRQIEALDLDRRSTQLEDWQQQTQATATSRALASNVGYLGIILLGALGAAYAIDRAARRREPLVRFGGELVPRRLIEDGRLIQILAHRMEMQDIALIEDRRRPNVPHVYSPHWSSRSTDLALPEPPAQLSAGTVPTFCELLNAGRIGKGNPLVLGYDTEDTSELTGSWLDLYSTIVAGMSGTGKTTTQRFLACQTALHGAKFAIIDPHSGATDDSLAGTLSPLSSTFVCEPASTDKAILEVVRYVADVGRRRIEGKDSSTTPLILWADELTALLGRSAIGDDLAQLLERIAQEYRKRWVFVCGSGQIFTAARTTSELRDSFASVLCHRMKRSQARLLLPTDEAEQVERLEVGHAVLWRTSGTTQTIQIPNTTATDCGRVASLLASNRHTDMPNGSQNEAYPMPERMPNGSQAVASGVLATSAPASAEAKRAAQMFMEGADPAAIVLALRNVRTSEGRRYQVALADVLNLVREGMRGA